MRPEVLYPLFAPVTALPGVGPRIAKLIERVAGTQVVDLYWHLPTGLIDRRFAPKVADAPANTIATLTLQVEEHLPPRNRRQPYKVRCADTTGTLYLVFFHARPDHLLRVLPPGETRVVSGRVEHYGKKVQITHPDHIGLARDLSSLKSVEPVYRLASGLSPKSLGKAIRGALDRAPELDEWIDPDFLATQQLWPDWRSALLAAHAPKSESDLAPDAPARARLAYDELLANQLALALVRHALRRRRGRQNSGDGRLRAKVRAALPYALTGAQATALEEIAADMATPAPMLRLLQGDVGSGKTLVALLAMLIAVEGGAQAALMAPTDLLARQHFHVLAPLADVAGVGLALLTGRDKGKQRQSILAGAASGALDLLVGTHALFQQDVAFRDLAMVVIDEQHRFGVHQRLALNAKGNREAANAARPDMLLMTATPIPRTLALTAYGDTEISRLTEKPPGRMPIDTRAMPLSRLDEVVGAVTRAIAGSARAYWVCPLISESEDLDLAAAEERFAHLKGLFGERTGLIHGRMAADRRETVMQAFAEGTVRVLVATTVIEVGVDVPEATIMVIEHAERFGLAQLHQLRGRVGRGSAASTCLLLYATPLGEAARARIDILRQTEDGFLIAEEDMRLRGAGEVLGTRQSGVPEFRVADLAHHSDLLAVARDDAKLCLERDADLKSGRGRALRVLLYLFERDAAVRNLSSG